MSGYLTGWLAGGNPRENRGGTYTVGFLNLDEAAIGAAAVTNVTVTGPIGVTFTVDLDTYEVTANAPFDFEAGNTVPLTIVIELDGTPQTADALNLTIRNVDEAPTGLVHTTLDVNENVAGGTVVATLAGVDLDAGDTSFTYQVIGSTLFEVVGSQLRVASGANLDHEAQASHGITLRVFDGSNSALFTDVTVTVAINDVNEPPSTPQLQGQQSVAENATSGRVATLAATDPEGHAITWSVLGNTNFTILNGNELHVAGGAVFDFDTTPTESLQVQAESQGGLTSSQAVVVQLTNVNEAPTAIQFAGGSIAEGAAIGTTAATLSSSDPDAGDSFVYSIVGSDPRFEIIGNALRLKAGATLDFETATSHDVTIRSTDAGGLSVDHTISISITNSDEAPSALVGNTGSIDENSAAGTVIATLAGLDPDMGENAAVQFSIPGGSTLFQIVGNSLRAAGTATDFETAASHVLTIRLTDGDDANLFRDVSFTITVNDVNEAPGAASLQSPATIAEGATAGLVGVLAATDPDGDAITWSVVGSTHFEILNGNELHVSATAALDFEAGANLGVTVRASSLGGLSSDTALTVSLSNVNEAPSDISLSAATIAENASAGTVIGLLGATDPDAASSFTFSIVGSDPRFEVVGNELRLKAGAGLDFETTAQHNVTIRTADQGGLTHDEVFSIAVTGTNEAPGAVSLNGAVPVAENATAGTVVGTLSAADPEGDTLTYSVIGDARFEVVGNQLRVASGASFDFETESSISLTLRAHDGTLHTDTQRSIAVSDVPEAPSGLTLSSSSVAENSAIGTVVATLTGLDPDGGVLSYSLQSGNGFQILGNQLRVAAGASLDHEAQASRNVTIRVTDAQGNHADFVRSIAISDVNEAPTGLSLSSYSVNENSAGGTVIATLSGTDPDGGVLTYTLLSGSGLQIVGNELRVAPGAVLNHEAAPSIDALIRVTDANGLSTGFLHSIAVQDIAEAPSVLTLSGNTIAEDTAAGAVVGMVSAQDDEGGPITLQMIDGAGAFELVGNVLRVASGASLDHETDASIDVLIRATDAQGNSRDFTRSITVSDVAEAPDALLPAAFSVDENAPGGTVLGQLSATDPQGGTLTYSLVSGTGFEIVGHELRLDAMAPPVLDFETTASVDLLIRVTDAQGHSTDFLRSVILNDINEAPTAITLDQDTVAENAAAGTVVALLSASDPDAGDGVSFSLGAPSDQFEVIGDQLRVAEGAVLDFEAGSSVDVVIRVTDGGGLTRDQVVTIHLQDVNEAPLAIGIDIASIAEGAAPGTVVGTLSGIDPDAGDMLSFALEQPSPHFEIIGNQLVIAADAALDFETAPLQQLQLRVTDANGLSQVQQLDITITDTNEAPVAPSLSALDVREGAEAGTVIGTLAASDPEADTLTYTLLHGPGLEIVGNVLRVVDGSLLSHQHDPHPTIDILVEDGAGNSILFQPVLAVGAPNIAPQELFLSATSLLESAAPGDVIAELSVDDPDSSAFTFEIVSGDGFAIDGNMLIVAPGASFDFETQSSIDVDIRVTDELGASQVFTRSITIDDLDEAPLDPVLTGSSVQEGAEPGTLVGLFSAIDPEGGAVTYAVQDDPAFAIDGDHLLLVDGQLLDHEVEPQRMVTLVASDAAGNQRSFTVTIDITNRDEAPDMLLLVDPAVPGQAAQLPENAMAGDAVARLLGHDPEGGQLTYTLLEGAGFTIDGDLLVVDGTVAFDRETADAVDLLIEVADEQGHLRQFTLTLPVADVNEAPTDLALSAETVAEDAGAGALIGEFSVLDPDLADSFSFTLDEPSNLFDIVGNTLRLRAGVTVDAETEASHTLHITATDAGGLAISRAFTIAVNDVNEAPRDLTLDASDVVENAAGGTVIGLLSASDPDLGDSLTYSLATASTLFEVVGDELRVRNAAALDFETAANHALTILATDANGLSTSLAVTVAVADANDAPSVAARFGVTELRFAENAPAGREVGGVIFSDPDAGDIVSLSLVGAHASRFALDGDRIRIAEGASLDYETLSSLSFGVRATDIGGLTATQMFTVNLLDVLEGGQSVNSALQGGGVYAGLQVQFDQDQALITVGDNQIMVPLTGEVELVDGTLSFGDGTMVAAVERLYLSMLGRGGDGDGRMAWLEMVEDGVPLSQIAQNFLDSPEFNSFVSNYLGAPSYAAVTNAEFTTLLYQRVLGRAPDQGGMDFWVNGLNTGAISRADMLSGFILSDEARERFADQTSQLWVVDQDALMVRSLYDIALGREPDADGLAFWKNALESGVPLGALADMIVGSPEFQTMLAQNSISEMVTQFYIQGLERAPDMDGLAFWSGAIANGAADWSDILVAIAMSPEQQSQFADYRDGIGIFNIT